MVDNLSRIMIVDDESNILSALRRQLRGKFELYTAESGEEGLKVLQKQNGFSVIISDYKMPGMNGDEFLSRVRDLYPDTVRIMLTGQADMEAVINIVNHGGIFRFLTKPCPPDLLNKSIDDGVEQYRLINAEKELISRTLSGSIQILTEFLVLAKPLAFQRTMRIRDLTKKILERISSSNAWQIEIAAMLSQLGCVTIPDSILEKIYRNLSVAPEHLALYRQHPLTSSELISRIPRLEGVSEIIRYQEKYYNGEGVPRNSLAGADIPLGARILRVVIDYDSRIMMDMTGEEALEYIISGKGLYDDNVVDALREVVAGTSDKLKFIIKEVSVNDLKDDMLLEADLVTKSGVLLGKRKQRITPALIITLKNHLASREIKEPFRVMINDIML